MENANINARIRAYLDGKMNDLERRAFEEELRNNASLHQRFLQLALWGQQPASSAEARARSIAAQLREKSGPLPKPSFSIIDHIRLEPRKMLARAAILIGILFVATPVIWVNLVNPFRPITEMTSDFIDPVQLGVAGSANDTGLTEARAIFERSSDFYWKKRNGGLDSLLHVAASCSGFCMAHYYLAHWYLDHRQYEKASNEFAMCLANSTYLQKFRETQDLDKLRLNKLLADLGATGKSEKLLSDLQSLIRGTPESSMVHKEAQSIYNELKSPLRIFSFR